MEAEWTRHLEQAEGKEAVHTPLCLCSIEFLLHVNRNAAHSARAPPIGLRSPTHAH